MRAGHLAGVRKLGLAVAGSALAAAAAATPALADSLPLPSPLPTVQVPGIVPNAPLPLPTLTPLPLISPLLNQSSSPAPGVSSGSTPPAAGANSSGSGAAGSSSTPAGRAANGAGGPGRPPGSVAAAAPPGPLGIGPLPAFPGLPRGAVQEVAWSLVIVVPLLLLVWVIVLFRMLMRLRHLRGSAGLLTAASELGLSPREIASLSPAALERLRDQLALDDLTGCMRRASGLASLERELARARREKSTLAIGFIDADGLKHANDTLGHAAGDQLLKEVSAGLRSRLRGSDFVFRYGGDEFVCVMPGAHSGDAAAVLTDVQAHLRLHGRSFSLGIAEFLPADTAVTLLGRADEALYAAKRALRGGAETSGAGRPRTGAVARPSQATAR